MGDAEEGEGESSWPARAPAGGGASSAYSLLLDDIYSRLIQLGNQKAISNPLLRNQLDAHLTRLPPRYGLDLNMDRVEDVLLHQKVLADAEDPTKRPVFHVRFLKFIHSSGSECDDHQRPERANSARNDEVQGVDMPPNLRRNRDQGAEFEPCSRLEDLSLDVNGTAQATSEADESLSSRQGMKDIAVHEIIFSSIDKPKLLSQLTALLSGVGLNIREAHVFSTSDGYSLDVFEVDGWIAEETESLLEELNAAVANNEGSLSGSSRNLTVGSQSNFLDWEIDKRLLKMGKRVARGSFGYLYRATYAGQDVAVKILRADQLNDSLVLEFNQEVDILRKVHHQNIVRFIGACTEPPDICILTEYMTGGNLYDYLHKDGVILELTEQLKFSIDICKGMEYLHQNNIIHRDLKTANLLMDDSKNVKVADFGVARIQSQEGVMTAETGTYRWMAPEIINHRPYDQKADVFSFAIVLWELATSRVPYGNMSPLQAALGVRQGLRPDLPESMHPGLLNLMQRCWDAVPAKRPSFQEMTLELEEILQHVQESDQRSKPSK